MKLILFLIILIFINFSSYQLRSEDALTVKQQLDRITQEINDLNKAVFNRSFDPKNINSNNDDQNNDQDVERFASIDLRIYDLEKDIKNLTLQFEEIIFKLDDLSNYINKIESELSSNLDELKNNNLTINTDTSTNNESNTSEIVKEENTLGKLVLSDNQTQVIVENEKVSAQIDEPVQNNELENLSPEEQFQLALDEMAITPITRYPPYQPATNNPEKIPIDQRKGLVSLPSLSRIFTLHL